MRRTSFFVGAIVVGAMTTAVVAQVKNFAPVTQEMLLDPSPDDWLMFSRTYDGQRFSPLKQINRQNVGQLRQVWKQDMGPGSHQSIPVVYRGVMYVAQPGAVVRAFDGASGTPIWEYRRKLPAASNRSKTKSLALYEDLLFYTAPDGYLVALDARTGEVRWEILTGLRQEDSSGPLVVEGKVMTGRSCFFVGKTRRDCFIAAHDARTGKEVWKFHTIPAPGEPGAESWGGADLEKMRASPWGLPGSYDAARRLIFWGIANPTPYTRLERHGKPDAVPYHAPADLYSNSTVALNPETGKLVWYYQHLPGDDWDEDFNQDKILLRTAVNPDPKFVKWINPDVPRGQQRDIVVAVGEPGGIWALDRATGQFLWATPFPFDVRNFVISNIDVKTGRTYINTELIAKQPGDRHLICFWNTRNYWPNAYHPGLNSLYIDYVDNCLDMTAASIDKPERRVGVVRPGSDPNAYAGIAKVNMSTGEIKMIHRQRAPGKGALLATAGDLVFWGDLGQKLRAFDADTGKILWDATLGGNTQNSTITYAVNGKQYVAVLTGQGGAVSREALAGLKSTQAARSENAVYAFALP